MRNFLFGFLAATLLFLAAGLAFGLPVYYQYQRYKAIAAKVDNAKAQTFAAAGRVKAWNEKRKANKENEAGPKIVFKTE